MRTYDAGRPALLQFLRAELRPETLPAPSSEPAHCGNLWAMRQPRTFDTAAQSVRLVADSRMARADVSRSIPRAAFGISRSGISEDAACYARSAWANRCPLHPGGTALVAMDI